MDNQTDPATAGAQPVYGPDPVETTSRSDEINPQKGYSGPTNIGSPSQNIAAVGSAIGSAGSVIAKGAPSIAENEAAPAGAVGDTFSPVGADTWKNFQDGLTLGANSAETDQRQFSLQDSVDNARENIRKAAGVDIPNPYVGAFAASSTAMQDYQNSLQDLLSKHQGDSDQDRAIRAAVEPALNMDQYADQWVKDSQAKAQMDIAKSNGTLLPWLAQQGGAMAGAFRSPINFLGLMVGGPELGIGGSALGRVLQEGVSQAAIQMGLTGLQEPGHQARAEQLGEEHGFWPIMHDLENSALGGFIGGSVIKGLHEIGGHFFGSTDQGVATEEFLRRAQDIPPPGGWPEGSESRGQAWRREMDEWAAQQNASKGAVVPYEGPDATGSSVGENAGPPPNEASIAARAATPPPKLNTRPEIANLPQTTAITPAAIEARELDATAPPATIPPEMTRQDALEGYAGTIRAGENPDVVAKPLAPPRTPDELPASSPESLSLPATSKMEDGQSFIKEDKPVTFQSFDPTKLQTNADVFQYKGGGNAAGVTDRLKGVGQWDPIAGSDPMVVYQWNGGREDVVNGHQRTGLAKALDAQGSLPEGTRSPGFLFKEADGWIPQDVRAFAAKVNLQQGSGDVLDSARILRERPDIWDKSLPTSDLKLKQAKGLAELSDDGWGMVLNGHVKPNLAALVGQGVPDKSAHTDLLQNIIDFKNADENSTRMMIADANAAGFREEEQSDIFGSTPVTKSLLRERAEVYSRVIQALRDDKKVFGLLDRKAERIEAAGNSLVGEVNVAQADRATQLASILEKLAVRQGPVSAALNRAASLVAEGGKAPVAARAFLRDIDRLMREEGLKLTPPAIPEPRTSIDLTTIPGQEQATEELRRATPTLPDEAFGSHPKPIADQRQAIFEDVRQKLLDTDMPENQANANAAVMAARYVARADRFGRTDPETLYRSEALAIKGGKMVSSKEDGGTARGSFTPTDNGGVISLFKKKNASTFMHEAAHKFLHELAGDAEEEGAPPQIKDDFQKVLDWAGAKDFASMSDKQHEKFAKGWEQYLREGKAPSFALQRAFDQFKAWLRSIYKSLVGLGQEIPNAIRGVMDRMIATDDEIAAARAAEHERLRAAPPTQSEAAGTQADEIIQHVGAQLDATLRAEGSPLAHEVADAIQKELKPAPVEPGSIPPREPAARPGTKIEKTVDMRSTGLRPKGKIDAASPISAAQGAWSVAQQTGQPALSALGDHGWATLKPTEALAAGVPYLEVTPEGVARFYGPEAGRKEASQPNEASAQEPAWYEKTAAGDQVGMPGVKPVSDADRARLAAEKPLRGGDEAPPAGGLFDEDAKAQIDWMDLVPTDDGLVPVSELKEELRPQTPEEKTFFQSAKTPAAIARQKQQKALALYAQGNLVKYFNAHRTVNGRRDIAQAAYDLFEDFGYSGHPSVRFLAESLTARTNAKIADALEHFARKTFYSDGSLVGGRRNRTDAAELQRAMFGEKTTPDMQRMARDILEALDEQRVLFNEKAGDTIAHLENWGGPQSHNAMAVYRAGGAKAPAAAKANWTSYIDPLLDWTKMRNAQTGEIYARTPPKEERQRILESVWEDIVTDGNLKEDPNDSKAQATSVANSRSDSRFFVFKDADSKIDYNKNYGEGDFLTQIAGHVRLMARDTALMTVFGPNPKAMVEWTKQGITKEIDKYKVGQPALIEGYKYDKDALDARAGRVGSTVDGYYQQFRGSNFAQGKIAIAGTILRNLAMGSLLGSSVIPHAVANPFIQMTARYYGGMPIMRAVPRIVQAFARGSKEEMLRSGLDLENGAYSLGESARYITKMQRWANATRWFPDRVSAWSGLHPFVEANRGAIRRDLVGMLADLQEKDWSQLPRAVLTKLKGYGINEGEWKILQSATPYKPTIGMAPWIRPTDVENAPADGVRTALGNSQMTDADTARAARAAAVKFGGYIMGETEVAVPSSSMRSRAFIIGDANPNNWWGQLRYSAGLFKGFIGSFMMSQAKANAEQATRGPGVLNPKILGRRFSLPHAAALFTLMTALGTLSLILKQMAAGKEIPSLNPMTPEGRKTWIHGAMTGGSFGWMGDFLASDQSSYGRGPLESLAGAPAGNVIDAFQTTLDAFTAATTKPATSGHFTAKEKAIEGLFKALRSSTPALSTLWYGRAAYNRMVLDQLQQWVDPQGHQTMRKTEERLLKENNQRFWWKPGGVLPREYPWGHSNR